MTNPFENGGAQAVYDLWLGLIPQFFSQLGVSLPPDGKAGAFAPNGAQATDWLSPWTAAMPFLSGATAKSAQAESASGAQPLMAPWAAMLSPYPGARDATPDGGAATADPLGAATAMFAPMMQPFQATQKAWVDALTRLAGVSPQSFMTGFDRTFGGLFDALGFGPMRKLQAACQELAAATLAQNRSRAGYAMLVQGAFASGLERLMQQLATMADASERVDSVLALLKMWAVNTEAAVHEVLQSEQGLAATAAMTRAGFAHRKKLQDVATIIADALDMTTRRELDEVYRELHELKRELRALRAPAHGARVQARVPAPAQPKKSKARARSSRRKATA